MSKDNIYYDDELKATGPSQTTAILANNNPTAHTPNPFFNEKEDGEHILKDCSTSLPPDRCRRNSPILNSPNIAIRSNKNTRMRAGNPILAKLSCSYYSDDLKSENTATPHSPIDAKQCSFTSLPPGTPKSPQASEQNELLIKTKSSELISMKTKSSFYSNLKKESKEIDNSETKDLSQCASKYDMTIQNELSLGQKMDFSQIPPPLDILTQSKNHLACCIEFNKGRDNAHCCIVI